jgi:nucleolar protein 15
MCSFSPDSLQHLSTGPEWESSDEDSVGKEPVQIKSKDEKYKKSRSATRKAASKKKTAEAAANTSSVLYIGHLPPHFEEHELVQFLKQFGKVLNLRVSRSKKTGNSKGFAFVQMQSPGIAAIVADTLAGYIMFGQRRLVCHVLPPDKIHKKLFFRQKRIVKEKQATEKPLGMMKAITSRLVAREHKKREMFKELGIDYEFPGYAAGKTEEVEAKPTKKAGKSATRKDAPTESTENKKSKKSKGNDSIAVETTGGSDSKKGKKSKDSSTSAVVEKKEKAAVVAVKKTAKSTPKAPSPKEAQVSFKQAEKKSPVKKSKATKAAVPQSEKKKAKKPIKSKPRKSV